MKFLLSKRSILLTILTILTHFFYGLFAPTIYAANYGSGLYGINEFDAVSSPTPTLTPTPTTAPDTQNPTAPGTPSTTSPTSSENQTWTWTAGTDALSGVSHYAWRVLSDIGEAIVNGTTGGLSVITNLAEGIYTFFVKTVDNALNESSESSGSVTVDTSAPTVSLTPFTPDPTSDTTPTYTGTATDTHTALTAIEYRVDSGSWTACTATDGTINELSEDFMCDISTLSEATYTISVRATDSTSHTSSGDEIGTDEITIDVDTPTPADDATAPTQPGDPTTTTPTNAPTQVWSWDASTDDDSGVSHYEWRVTTSLDVAVTQGSTSDITTTTSLVEGSYVFYAKAVDNASNESEETSGTVLVDTTAPVVSLTPISPNPTNNSTPFYTGTATDALTEIENVQFRIDSGTWLGCLATDSAFDELSEQFICTFPQSADATYEVDVRALDAAGNYTATDDFGNDVLTINTTVETSSAPASNTNSSSGSNPSQQATGCSASAPSSAPDLFQIIASGRNANLFFAPASGSYTSYTVEYGLQPDEYIYNASFDQGYASGAIQYQINLLNTNTLYYFRVRANNNCRPGNWSNVISVRTTNSDRLNKTYFKFFPAVRAIVRNVTQQVNRAIQPTTNTSPTNVPTRPNIVSPIPPSESQIIQPVFIPQTTKPSLNIFQKIINFFRGI